MLNIEARISLSKASKAKIKSLKKATNNRLQSDSWKSIHKSVKNEISKKLLAAHGFKCVYCERDLIGLSHQIDHFAHKADYPEFTFIPVNVFYACGFCNSSAVKGQKNVIAVLEDRYDQTIFEIVHPYYNNPENEIAYRDQDRVDIDLSRCTNLGKRTIVFFKYHEPFMTMIRAKQLIHERMNPLVKDEERQLIQEAIAYK